MGQWDGGIVWVGVWMCDFGWMRGEGGREGRGGGECTHPNSSRRMEILIPLGVCVV